MTAPIPAYLIRVSPVFGQRSRYIWAITGTQTMFHQRSDVAYDSVEQALAEAQARLAQLG